jgi:hypothetical protein
MRKKGEVEVKKKKKEDQTLRDDITATVITDILPGI